MTTFFLSFFLAITGACPGPPSRSAGASAALLKGRSVTLVVGGRSRALSTRVGGGGGGVGRRAGAGAGVGRALIAGLATALIAGFATALGRTGAAPPVRVRLARST